MPLRGNRQEAKIAKSDAKRGVLAASLGVLGVSAVRFISLDDIPFVS